MHRKFSISGSPHEVSLQNIQVESYHTTEDIFFLIYLFNTAAISPLKKTLI